MKKILLLTCFCWLAIGMSANELWTSAEDEMATVELRIEVTQNTLRVDGGSGKVAEVYDVAGNRVASYEIDCDSKTVQLDLTKGIYLIRIDKVVRKVYIS